MSYEPVDIARVGPYAKSLTIPADTSEDSPTTDTITIKEGVITRVFVHFPSGCNAMVNTECYYGPYRIFPIGDSEAFRGDGETIPIRTYWPLPEEPCELTLKGWSPDTQHEHTVIWRFEVLPKAIMQEWRALAELVELMKTFLGVEE